MARQRWYKSVPYVEKPCAGHAKFHCTALVRTREDTEMSCHDCYPKFKAEQTIRFARATARRSSQI